MSLEKSEEGEINEIQMPGLRQRTEANTTDKIQKMREMR
jgi:hypothetical protein